MIALYIQIILGVIVFFGILIAFFITVRSNQYDDLDSPAHRILMDDDDIRIPSNRSINHKSNTINPINKQDI